MLDTTFSQLLIFWPYLWWVFIMQKNFYFYIVDFIDFMVYGLYILNVFPIPRS